MDKMEVLFMNSIANSVYKSYFYYHLTNLKARIDAWPSTTMKHDLLQKLLYIEQSAKITEADYIDFVNRLKKMKLQVLEFDLCLYCLKGLIAYSFEKSI